MDKDLVRGRGSQGHKDRLLRGSVPQSLLVVSALFRVPLKAPTVGSSKPTVPGRGIGLWSETQRWPSPDSRVGP